MRLIINERVIAIGCLNTKALASFELKVICFLLYLLRCLRRCLISVRQLLLVEPIPSRTVRLFSLWWERPACSCSFNELQFGTLRTVCYEQRITPQTSTYKENFDVSFVAFFTFFFFLSLWLPFVTASVLRTMDHQRRFSRARRYCALQWRTKKLQGEVHLTIYQLAAKQNTP